MTDEIAKVEKEPVDRQAIAKYNAALAADLWQGKLTAAEKRAVKNLCLSYGLEPLAKPIDILGGNVYINRSGITQIAGNSDDPPQSILLTPATDEERRASMVPEGEHYWRCEVMTVKGRGPFVEYGHASAKNVRLMNAGWREHQDMAKTRAYNRCMRLVYNIGITSFEELGVAHVSQRESVTLSDTDYQDLDAHEKPLERSGRGRPRAQDGTPTPKTRPEAKQMPPEPNVGGGSDRPISHQDKGEIDTAAEEERERDALMSRIATAAKKLGISIGSLLHDCYENAVGLNDLNTPELTELSEKLEAGQ